MKRKAIIKAVVIAEAFINEDTQKNQEIENIEDIRDIQEFEILDIIQ